MKQIPDTARRHHVNRASPVRRPKLPRAQPIRNFAGVFGASSGSAGAHRPADARADDERPDKRRAKGKQTKNKKPPMSAPAATVARGVNAGYRVIEEYLRQGQQFARSLWPAAGGGARSGGGGTVEAPMNMTERLVRSASDLVALFSELLQTFSVPGTLPAPGSTPIPDFGIGRQPASPSPPAAASSGVERRTGSADAPGAPAASADVATTISIDLRSLRRTAVTASLQPGAWSERLQVHDLRSRDAGAKSARLTGVTATTAAADRRVVIAVEVPDGLAAGTYSGLMVDADTNLPRGTLSIQVFAEPAPRPVRKAARR